MNNLIVRAKVVFFMIFSCFYIQVQSQDYSYSTREFNMRTSLLLESDVTEIEFEDLSWTPLTEGEGDDDSFMLKFEVDAKQDDDFRVLTFYYDSFEILRVSVKDGTFLVQRRASVADTDFYIDYQIFDPMFPTADTFPYTVKMYVSKNLLWFESDKSGGDERIYHSTILWGLNDFVKDNRGASTIDYVDEFLTQTENAKIKIENIDSGSQLRIYTYKHSELLDDINNGFSQVPRGWRRVVEDISGTYFLINSEGKCLAEHGPNEKVIAKDVGEDDYSRCTVFKLDQKVGSTAQYTLEGPSHFLKPKTKNFYTSTKSVTLGVFNQISDTDKYRFGKLAEPYTLVSTFPDFEDPAEVPVSSSGSHSGLIHKILFENVDLYKKIGLYGGVPVAGIGVVVAAGFGIRYLVISRTRSSVGAADRNQYRILSDHDSGSEDPEEVLPERAPRVTRENVFDEIRLRDIQSSIEENQRLLPTEFENQCHGSMSESETEFVGSD